MTTPKRRIERLIFVFSADAGTFNAFLDSAKKFLKIKGCTLCSITHGLAGEKSEWRLQGGDRAAGRLRPPRRALGRAAEHRR